MTAEPGGDPIGALLREAYREEAISLLKYRKLAQSLERLYGSGELLDILRDEEAHARLLVELSRELRYDVGDVGEEALIRELQDMAAGESRMAELYERAMGQIGGRSEYVMETLRVLASDSTRHHKVLTNLSKSLKSRSAEKFSSHSVSEARRGTDG